MKLFLAALAAALLATSAVAGSGAHGLLGTNHTAFVGGGHSGGGFA